MISEGEKNGGEDHAGGGDQKQLGGYKPGSGQASATEAEDGGKLAGAQAKAEDENQQDCQGGGEADDDDNDIEHGFNSEDGVDQLLHDDWRADELQCLGFSLVPTE